MYEYTNVLFERGLGFVNLVAFLSYYVQLLGLVGEHGLLPAKSTLHNLRYRPMMLAQRFGLSLRSPVEPKKVDVDTFLNNFSVFWFGASDRMLKGVCLAGVAASVLATLGWFTPIMIAVCSVCYLSLMTVGQTFFMFQWDSFLLECNGLYVFTTPLRWYSPWVLSFAGRILVARLLLSSGVVKTTSGCEKWRNLTALHYHYWTQPLPNILAVYAHRLPDWFHRMSVVMTVFLQVFVPWLCFGPGQYIRAFAFVFMCKMQAVIAVTGNYGFFNILSLVACIPILDDYAWRKVMPGILQPNWLPPIEGHPLSVVGWGVWCLSAAASAAFLFFYAQLQLVPLASCARVSAHGKMQDIFRWLQNFNLINRYGLFASMTTFRKELIIEGSEDGENWEEYEFYHKPGNPFKKPPNLPFHMPRVDWRLWFIPLGSYFPHTDPPTWYLSLLSNLLLGNPTVSALLEYDPFRGHPPKYIRTRVYHFVFAHSAPKQGKRLGIPESLPNHCLTRRDFEEPKADQWWYRELLQGAYGPIVTKHSAEVITNAQHETAERFEPMPVRETLVALWKNIDWKELWANTKSFPVKDVAQHSWRTLRDILWFCKRLLQIEIAATKKLMAERWGVVRTSWKRAPAGKTKEPLSPMTPASPVETPKSA